MMQTQLTLDRLLVRAQTLHKDKEVVSRLADGRIHRYTLPDFYQRTVRLMSALRRLGVRPGDRVASFGWNSYRHLELYYAVPVLGAILHTINIRLSPDQISYLIDHAEDRILFVDRSLLPVVAPLLPKLRSLEQVIVMDDHPTDPAPLPDNALDFDEVLASGELREDFPALDEQQGATLCYTSGTTGVLKGVLYSHRSIVLHAMAIGMVDGLALSGADCALQLVPMFHVNGWGMPYSALFGGTKLVFPGSQTIGAPVAELIANERVTIAAGVPSIWFVLHRILKSGKYDISSLKRVVIGGAAAPKSLIESYVKDFGVQFLQCWGMTETSPLGANSRLQPFMRAWPEARQFAQLARQGQPAPLVELKIVDEHNQPVPPDGATMGELLVRGPWVTQSYFRHDQSPTTSDGWLRTGDVATLDEYGYMAITDRKKDLIKTRGEWLSSVEMENSAMGYPPVLEAAVVGRPDQVRDEAVVIFVVIRPEHVGKVTALDIATHLRAHFQGWQVPKLDDIHFVDSIPKTSVGKFDKRALRERRIAIAIDVSLIKGARRVAATSSNISTTGLFVLTDDTSFALGDVVTIVLLLPKKEAFNEYRSQARIVRRADDGYGIELVDADPELLEAVAAL